jgi:hypothetical protein
VMFGDSRKGGKTQRREQGVLRGTRRLGILILWRRFCWVMFGDSRKGGKTQRREQGVLRGDLV